MPSPPSLGDDATPFLLRCYARRGPFRPLADFEQGTSVLQDDFKLYVWKTTTLREIAQMLHEADSSLSRPLSPHAFRVVHSGSHRSPYTARGVGAGVTRVALQDIDDLMDGIELDTATSRALEEFSEELDEKAAKTTLQQLRIGEGDGLDCSIRPDPTIPSAPAAQKFGPGGHGPGRPRQY